VSPRVFLADLNVLATHWRFGVGTGASISVEVPEPDGWLLSFSTILAALSRNSRGRSVQLAAGDRMQLQLEGTIR
jgi:hypothetical protein